jgi:Lon protease-like protein
MNSKLSLPLFPLNTVLFPGQVLPLHIFEKRYRHMIGQCIEQELPFGVVLIQEGEEVGGPAKPYSVGTTARITQVERLDDGRLNIMTVGEMRFRIVSLRHEPEGYLRASAMLWPWLPGDESTTLTLAQNVRDRLRRYVEMLSRASGVPLEADDLPEQPAALACLTAIALQVAQTEKQKLLTLPSIAMLLSKEVALLRRESRMLQVMIASRVRPTDDDTPLVFSIN